MTAVKIDKLFFHQVRGMLWKNLIISYHNIVGLIFEILVPFAAAIFIAWLLGKIQSQEYKKRTQVGTIIPPTVDPTIDFDFQVYTNQNDPEFCYAPINNDTEKIANEMFKQMKKIDNNAKMKLKSYKNESEMTDGLAETYYSKCVIFEDTTGLSEKDGKFKYAFIEYRFN